MLGPVTAANAAVGPVISEHARDSIRRALEASDAERVYEGRIPDIGGLRERLVPAADGAARCRAPIPSIAQRELFGPVLAMFPADDLDHAISLANDTAYGLSASLFTRDLPSALRYVKRIKAGLVRVNGDTTGVDPHAPFGGMKGSSSGSREQGGRRASSTPRSRRCRSIRDSARASRIPVRRAGLSRDDSRRRLAHRRRADARRHRRLAAAQRRDDGRAAR